MYCTKCICRTNKLTATKPQPLMNEIASECALQLVLKIDDKMSMTLLNVYQKISDDYKMSILYDMTFHFQNPSSSR